MFKKNEESEWTRFSRALQSQPSQRDEAVEPDEDDTVELAATGHSTVAEGTRDELPPPSYSRSEPAYTRPEPTYARPEPTYEPDEPAGYDEPDTPPYSTSIAAPTVSPHAAPMASLADSTETVLGEGASLEGTLRSDRSIRILGFLSGEIESRARVIVETNARVEARIVAADVTVVGEVNGQIECTGRVEIAPTGRVTGEVKTGRLAIQEGAIFQGQLTMVPTEAAPSATDASSGDVLDDGPVG